MMIFRILPYETTEMVLQNACFNAVGVVLFLINPHKLSHYKHAFVEKAQHLWRCISLRTFTRGRLVPRQPRAIKRTTRTELRGESIQDGRYIHCNIDITPTALHHEGIYIAKFIYWNNSAIPMQLCVGNIHHGGCIH